MTRADGRGWRATSRYEGDLRVAYTLDSDNEVVNETVELSGGRRSVVRHESSRSGETYTEQWRWDGDRPLGWRRDHDDATTATVTTITARGHDLVERQCADGEAVSCDVVIYTGTHDHWTRRTLDRGADGVLDEAETQTYDAHGLPVLYERSFDGQVGIRQTYVREPNGSPLRWRFQVLDPPPFNLDFNLSYDYACE